MTDQERYERGQAIVREVEREFAGRPMPEMVEEVRARVEKLMVTEGGSYCSYLMAPVKELPIADLRLPNEKPIPGKAFPDHFYYKPVIAEDSRAEPVLTSSETIRQFNDRNRQQWIAPTENFGKKSHQDWNRSEPAVAGLLCMCGHEWKDHAPACVHLIEGCGCEGFLKVPQGCVEGA